MRARKKSDRCERRKQIKETRACEGKREGDPHLSQSSRHACADLTSFVAIAEGKQLSGAQLTLAACGRFAGSACHPQEEIASRR
jgi:hypothetical protein